MQIENRQYLKSAVGEELLCMLYIPCNCIDETFREKLIVELLMDFTIFCGALVRYVLTKAHAWMLF
jgi:hypothetical protein